MGAAVLRVHAADGVRGVPDLGLAGEEHEHVARRLAVELVEGVDDALQVVAVVDGSDPASSSSSSRRSATSGR